MSPSSVPRFPQAKDTGPAGALAWPGCAAVFHAAARLLSPERRWMFLIRGFFFPAALRDFGTKQEKHRFAERLGERPAAEAGATPASTRAGGSDLARIRQTASCLRGVRPAERGELLIQGWRGLPASKDLPARGQGQPGSGRLPLALFPRMFWLWDRAAAAAPGVRSVSSGMGQPWVSLAKPPKKFGEVEAASRNPIRGCVVPPRRPVPGCP